MNSCFYRLVCSFFLFGSLIGSPSQVFAQEHLQMPWDDFGLAIDSFSLHGETNKAITWVIEREEQALQAENWEELLGCVNKYSRLVEIDNGPARNQKILSSRWIASHISEPSAERANYYLQLGDVYLTHLRKYDSAQVFVDQALSDFIHLDMWEFYAYGTIVKGLAYYFEGKYEETEAWWLKGLDSATLHLEPNSSAFPTVLNALGALHTALGNYDKSLVISQRTLERYDQIGPLTVIDSQFLGTAYINRGHTFLEIEDYDQALEHIRHAKFLLSNLSQRDPRDMILAEITEGTANWKLGEKENAYGIWMDMLKKTENQANYEHERMAITVYQYLSEYHVDKGETELALDYLLRAYKLRSIEKSNDAQTLLDIGNLYLKTRQFDLAKTWLDRAMQHTEQTFQGKNHQVSSVCIGKANYYQKTGDPEKALEFYQLALIHLGDTFSNTDPDTNPSIQEVSNKIQFLKVLQGKANLAKEIYLTRKEEKWLNIAAGTFDVAISLIDDIRTSFRTEGSKLKLAETAQRVYDGAIQIALIRHQNHPHQALLKEAFAYAEKNKGLSLREALQESDAKQFAGIPAYLLAREHKLKTDLANYRKKIFDADPSSPEDSLKILFWQDRQFELRKTFLGLIDTLERDYPDYYKLKYREESIQATEVMAQLETGSAMVEYFWGEENLIIFCLTQDSIWAHTLAIDTFFLEELGMFRSALIEKPSDIPAEYLRAYQAFGERSYGLYQKLIAPVMNYQGIQELLIVPDGALGYIPFEVLITNFSKGAENPSYAQFDYLFKSCKIRYEYAAAFLDHTYIGKKSHKKMIGFAPVYGAEIPSEGSHASRGQWQQLRHNQDELKQIHKLIGGNTYLAENATKQKFLTEAPDYAILHLAMHGFINDRDPLYSGLAFTPESSSEHDSTGFGLLYAYELYNLSLQAELAVLSACNTGTGQLLEGEGIMSMARAFRYAGCPSIVTSLWSADDRATISLMEFFYQNLADGMEKDAALQAARASYFASTRRDHPYYWAGFILVGEKDVLTTSSYSRYARVGGGLFLLILLIIGGRKAIRKRNG